MIVMKKLIAYGILRLYAVTSGIKKFTGSHTCQRPFYP